MKHLLLDCHRVGHLEALKRVEVVQGFIGEVLEAVHMNVVGVCPHQFQPHGATVVFLLAESHCSCHTFWQEKKMFIDLFSCADFDHERVVELLVDKLGVSEHSVQLLDRPLSGPLRSRP